MTLRTVVPALLVAAFALLSQACEPRFSPCKKDNDCSGKAHRCVQHKCLECRSDDDCTGGYCSMGACYQLGGPKPHVTAAPSAEPAPADGTDVPEAPPP